MNARRMLALGISLSLIVEAGYRGAAAAEVFVPYRVLREDGAYIDWLDGHAGIMGLASNYLHFVELQRPLTSVELEQLQALLRYGPRASTIACDRPAGTVGGPAWSPPATTSGARCSSPGSTPGCCTWPSTSWSGSGPP